MQVQPGSLEHFGQIFCPISLIGIVTNEVVETTYKEVVTLTDEEKHALAQAIVEKSEPSIGAQTIFVSLDFEDRIIDGPIRVIRQSDPSGHESLSIDWHQLDATDEDCKRFEVMVDAKEMNARYLPCY